MPAKILSIAVVAVALAGCTQMKTSQVERTGLEAAATAAGQAYVDCILDASDRYQQTGETAGLIVEVSKKACATERDRYLGAEESFLRSRYMSTQPILERELAALETRATTLVNERVLEQRAAAPAAAAVSTVPAMPPPDGNGYLDCMRREGQRYASVNEPAEVVAEVAHSRCLSNIADQADPASAAQLERQGRALVMGMVLDRKATRSGGG